MRTVSVVVPCFNHARFLREALDSILNQTYRALEVIVVDDCSTDDSWQVIEEAASQDPRVRGLRHERNEGLSRSRNDALNAANADYIGFCDADDVWEREKLEVELKLLQANPSYGAVYSDTLIIDGQGHSVGKRFSDLYPPPQRASGWLFPELIKRNFVNVQSVVMHKKCLRHVGLFDERVEWIQDWWYWIQLSRQYPLLYCELPLGRYRVHGGSTRLVHERAYSLNRFKVFGRILRAYGEISHATQADILYEMGVDLCRLGRARFGRRFFLRSMHQAAREPGASIRFCKAALRLCLCSAANTRI